MRENLHFLTTPNQLHTQRYSNTMTCDQWFCKLRLLHFTDNTKIPDGTERTGRAWQLRAISGVLYDLCHTLHSPPQHSVADGVMVNLKTVANF
jgi:hypothetical protein